MGWRRFDRGVLEKECTALKKILETHTLKKLTPHDVCILRGSSFSCTLGEYGVETMMHELFTYSGSWSVQEFPFISVINPNRPFLQDAKQVGMLEQKGSSFRLTEVALLYFTPCRIRNEYLTVKPTTTQ